MSALNKKRATMVAVGSYECILPFKAIGLEAVVITEENRGNVSSVLRNFAKSDCAVLFLEEDIFEEYRDAVQEASEYGEISIIAVPGQKGSSGAGLSEIRRNVERAVGMDIFGDK